MKKSNVKLFTIGDFKGGSSKFSEEDLHQIVDNSKKFKDSIIPVLKFGHGEKQVFLKALAKKYNFELSEKEMMGEQVIGLGKINELYVKGDALYAGEIADIPSEFADFVNDQSARRFSPEFYKMKEDGRVLRAISVVEIPENKQMEYLTFSEEEFVIDKNKEEFEMENNKKIESLNSENEQLKVELQKFKEEKAALEIQVKRAKIDGKIKDHLNAGNITEGQKAVVTEIYEEIYGISTEKFDETKVSKFEEFLNTLKSVDLETKTPTVKAFDEKKEPADEPAKETFSEMDDAIKKIMSKDGIGYGEAQAKYFEMEGK